MPVNQPQLQASKKGFTQQDFLDGKCTKEGLPLGGEASAPEPEPTPQVEPGPVANETQPQEAVGEESPADGQELPEQPKEGE